MPTAGASAPSAPPSFLDMLADHRRRQRNEDPEPLGLAQKTPSQPKTSTNSKAMPKVRDQKPDDEPVKVEDAVEVVVEAAAKGSSASPSIAQRLELKFGLGDSPRLRRHLYKRLERLVGVGGDQGELVYQLICESVAQACSIKQRTSGGAGRYFCKSILAKLREHVISAAPDTESPKW